MTQNKSKNYSKTRIIEGIRESLPAEANLPLNWN